MPVDSNIAIGRVTDDAFPSDTMEVDVFVFGAADAELRPGDASEQQPCDKPASLRGLEASEPHQAHQQACLLGRI